MRIKTFFLALPVLLMFVSAYSIADSSTQNEMKKKPLLSSIDHVALNVKDLNASLHFYSEIMGLEEIPAAAVGRKWLKITEGLQLHLLGDRQLELVNNKNIHIAFRCPNLNELIQRLDANKIVWGNFKGESRAISASRTDGVQQIFFQDPDGYWIEVNDAKN